MPVSRTTLPRGPRTLVLKRLTDRLHNNRLFSVGKPNLPHLAEVHEKGFTGGFESAGRGTEKRAAPLIQTDSRSGNGVKGTVPCER